MEIRLANQFWLRQFAPRWHFSYLLWAAPGVGSKPVELRTFISDQGNFAQISQTFLDLFPQKSQVFALKFIEISLCIQSMVRDGL